MISNKRLSESEQSGSILLIEIDDLSFDGVD